MSKLSINNIIENCEESFSENHFIANSDSSFPIDVFPKLLKNTVEDLCATYSYNADFLACSMLSAASSAIGLTHQLKVKGSWMETVLMYMALVGRPGVNKSAPLELAYEPLYQKDAHLYDVYQKELNEFKNARNAENAENAVNINRPKRKQWIINDATLEAIAFTLSFNGRGIALVNDELAGWIKNFGRYNKGSDMEFWLSNFSGKSLSINRKGDDSILISNPFINVAGTIQPGILNKLIDDSNFDNGFWDRILLVYPSITTIPQFKFEEPNEDYTNVYSSIIEKLISLDFNDRKPNYLSLSQGAKDLFKSWNQTKNDLVESSANDKLASIYAKLEIYVFRFSLLYQLLFWACNELDKETVGFTAMQAAISTVEYFKETALKIYPVNQQSNSHSFSVQQMNILNDLKDEFSTGEAVLIAEGHGMPERTFKDWLKNKSVFIKQRQGLYKKTFTALSALSAFSAQ